MLSRPKLRSESAKERIDKWKRACRYSVKQRGDARVYPGGSAEQSEPSPNLEFYGSSGGVGGVLLLVDNAEDDLLRWSKRKGFILWLVFFLLFCAEQWILFDTVFGHETLAVYRRARDSHDLPEYMSLTTDLECEHFITHELEEIIEYSYELCPECHIAVAAKSSDMHILTMADLICTDWTIDAETAHYPLRDCHAADASWRANPTAYSAPCCDTPDLVLASIALMAAHKEHGIETETMEHLTNLSDGAVGQREIHAYVDHHIDSDNFLLQLLISRDERMVGVMYTAERVDPSHQPHLVKPASSYWSFNYYAEAEGHTTVIVVLMYAAWCLSLIHELTEVYSAAPSVREAARGVFSSSFLLFVEIPSFIMPVAQRFISGRLDVNTVLIISCASIMIGAARSFQEAGEVIGPVRLIVQTFSNAIPQTLGFFMVAVPAMVLLGFVQSLLFGVFLLDYADFKHAFAKQFSIFQMGAEIDDETRKYAPVGTEIMYYGAPFVLFLVMSQFLIAIFVGAFDETRQQFEREEQEKLERFAEQTRTVELIAPVSTRRRWAGILYFALTWRSPWGGGWMAHALREVYRFNRHFEEDDTFNFDRTLVEESDVRARSKLTLCSREELEKYMTPQEADGLLQWFGCRANEATRTKYGRDDDPELEAEQAAPPKAASTLPSSSVVVEDR